MDPLEGVIKFSIVQPYSRRLYFNSETKQRMKELNHWRHTLFELDVIGCDLSRYGACYGNVSMRYMEEGSMHYAFARPKGLRTFLITGTQTGSLEEVTQQHYVRIYKYECTKNRVFAEGPLQPSSESMTHGAIYDLPLELDIRYVMHVHSPQIWKNASRLEIPVTNDDVAYGTPAMAVEVQRLFWETDLREKKIFAMGGHEDGVMAFGNKVTEVGEMIMEYLQKSVL